MCRNLWIFILAHSLWVAKRPFNLVLSARKLLPGCSPLTLPPPCAATSTPDLSLANMPSATPTLRVHTVIAGEVLSYIAGMYGVTVPAIVAANPGLNQDVLSVGQKINIPGTQARWHRQRRGHADTHTRPGGSGHTQLPACTGWRCLVLLAHPQRYGQSHRECLGGHHAFRRWRSIRWSNRFCHAGCDPSRDHPAHCGVYSGTHPGTVHRREGSVSTGLIVPTGDTRYLVNHIEGLLIGIQPDGRSAQVSGEVRLDGASVSPSHVWVALVAYNAAGKIVGVRRLEYTTTLSFSSWVYSQGDAIVRVEVVAEV